MGFIRDCFTGEDSHAGKPPREPDPPVTFDTIAMVVGVATITLIMAAINPALGAFVLLGGLALAWVLDTRS